MARTTRGEEKIISILKKENFHFVREKTYPNLKKHGHNLRLDFYLPSQNIAIEMNGAQHYVQIKKFQKERKNLLKQQEYDRHKISYCLTNKIPLYIIPYWEIDNMKTTSDIFQDKFLAKTKWHNDIVYREYKERGH